MFFSWSLTGFAEDVYFYDSQGQVQKVPIECTERHTRNPRPCGSLHEESTIIGIKVKDDNTLGRYYSIINIKEDKMPTPGYFQDCDIDPQLIATAKPAILRVLISWSVPWFRSRGHIYDF